MSLSYGTVPLHGKGKVYLLCHRIAETAHSACCMHLTYTYLVVDFGNFFGVLDIIWYVQSLPPSNGAVPDSLVIDLGAQGYVTRMLLSPS